MDDRMSLKKIALIFVLSIGAMLPPAMMEQDAAAGKTKAERCAACHGADGNSVAGTFPILAGQTARYLYLQMRDFNEGARKDPVMSPQLAGLNKQDFFDLAAYFAAQTPKPVAFKVDPARV